MTSSAQCNSFIKHQTLGLDLILSTGCNTFNHSKIFCILYGSMNILYLPHDKQKRLCFGFSLFPAHFCFWLAKHALLWADIFFLSFHYKIITRMPPFFFLTLVTLGATAIRFYTLNTKRRHAPSAFLIGPAVRGSGRITVAIVSAQGDESRVQCCWAS